MEKGLNFNDDLLVDNLKSAYRKWKSSTYFDQFLSIDANRIAFFEIESLNDQFFRDMAEKISTDEFHDNYLNSLIDQVQIRCFPKTSNSNGSGKEKKQTKLISNVPQKNNNFRFQYFIDLPLEAHILGALWVMKFGCLIDKNLIDQCYGNRIRKSLINDKNNSPTSYLYYPYFKKYESWRDDAIDVVEKLLDMKLNALMVSLDIESYFYNCRVDFNSLYTYLNNIKSSLEKQELSNLGRFEFLNLFVEKIFKKYSSFFQFSNNENPEILQEKPLIPIGFLPSYVIANWYLDEFDRNVKKIINPSYYGRYVDDILIVFSLNDPLFDGENCEEVINEKLEDYFKGVIKTDEEKKTKSTNNENYLFIDRKYLRGETHELRVKNDKVKIFYFSHENSRELINKFKENIIKNSSVFLHLHEEDDLFTENYYSKIWDIDYSDSINKIRSVEELSVNKFEFSRWLSFLLNFSGKIPKASLNKIIQIIFEIFSCGGYISYFTLWEKTILFLFKHKQYSEIGQFIVQALDEISLINIDPRSKFSINSVNGSQNMKETLREILFINLQKTFSLRNNKKIRKLVDEIVRLNPERESLRSDRFRDAYLKSYMFNTQIVFNPFNYYSTTKKYDLFKSKSKNPSNIKTNINKLLNRLQYFPRYIHLHEFEMYLLKFPFVNESDYFPQGKDKLFIDVWKLFWKINYGIPAKKEKPFVLKNLPGKPENLHSNIMNVGDNKKSKKIRIGISNVRVDPVVFENNLKDHSLFDRKVRHRTSKIINLAIDEKVDFLVLPECFVNSKWINNLTRISKDHQMGMVFGLEHVINKRNRNVYNYLITLLPFKQGLFNNCVFDIRLKNHYSPSEKEMITGYFYKVPTSSTSSPFYTMYNWQGFYFVPYSCFEIASIEDRSIFKSYIDAIIAIEWNKDIDYFSNIIESLSRDLHCFCIQVNSSDYGDNRITQPARSAIKDIIRAKGGENDYLIVGEIDINELRNFQIKDYVLQKKQEQDTGKFKPTPPGFDYKKVKSRGRRHNEQETAE